MLTIWTFDNIENEQNLYRGEDCIKKFCSSIRKHATNIIDIEKKKNVNINKRRAKTTPTCKCILYLWKKNIKQG